MYIYDMSPFMTAVYDKKYFTKIWQNISHMKN